MISKIPIKVVLIYCFVCLSTILPWFIKGLFGLDWSDTSYHYQEALNIFNGLDLVKDINSHVPGLSFFLESKIFTLLGSDFSIHRYLGLIFPILQSLVIFLFFFSANKTLDISHISIWAICLALIPIITVWGEQLYWNFTDLSISISFLIFLFLFLFLSSNYTRSKVIFFITISFLVGVQVLIKQSHGIINLITVNLAIAIALFFKNFSAKNIFLIIFFSIACMIFFSTITFNIYCPNCGSIKSLLFQNSLELKGLNNAKNIIGTILGINSFTLFLTFFITIVGGIGFYVCLQKFKLISPYLFILLIMFSFVTYYYQSVSYLTHYIVITLLSIQAFELIKRFTNNKKFFCSYHGNLSLVIFLSQFPLVGSLVAEQLSWPGLAYVHPNLNIVLLMLGLSQIMIMNKISISKSKAPIFFILISIFFSAYFVDTKENRVQPKIDGLIKITNHDSFMNWPVAPKTHKLFQELMILSRKCSGNTLFQLSWVPISYEVTGRNNTTNYYLPYHDTITINDAKEILDNLKTRLPDMLIYQKKYENFYTPLPSNGLSLLYKNFGEIKQSYEFKKSVSDEFVELEIYCKPTLNILE